VFRIHGCDFADPAGAADAPPCGGLVALAHLLDQGLVRVNDLESIWTRLFPRIYPRLAEHASLRLLEKPYLATGGLIALASTFILGTVIDRLARLGGVKPPLITSLVLLGTLKNYALAGGLALTPFSQQTAVPAAVLTIFMIVYIMDNNDYCSGALIDEIKYQYRHKRTFLIDIKWRQWY